MGMEGSKLLTDTLGYGLSKEEEEKQPLTEGASSREEQGCLTATCPDDGDMDALAARCKMVGVDLPPSLATEKSRWISLCMVFAACVVISGPVYTWQTLEPALIKMGVFGGVQKELDAVYDIGMGMATVSGLPIGLLYDTAGPRATAVSGALLSSIGLALMAWAVTDAARSSWILYIAYPLAVSGGLMNGWALYPFAWALPGHQNMVNSLMMAASGVSSCAALAGVALYAEGIPLQVFFASLSIVGVVGAFVCLLLVPSLQETKGLSTACMMMQPEASPARLNVSEEDIEEPETPLINQGNLATEAAELGHPVSSLPAVPEDVETTMYESMIGTWNAVTEHPVANSLFMTFNAAYYAFGVYVSMQQYFYYKALLGKQSADDLIDIFALIGGFGGAALCVVAGCWADRVGLPRFVMTINIMTTLFIGILLWPSFGGQIVGQWFLALVMDVYVILIARAAMLYVAPSLFGTYVGGLTTILGLLQLVLLPWVDWLSQSSSGIRRYTVPIISLGAVSMVCGIIMNIFWFSYPPPKLGGGFDISQARDSMADRPLTPRDVAEEHGHLAWDSAQRPLTPRHLRDSPRDRDDEGRAAGPTLCPDSPKYQHQN